MERMPNAPLRYTLMVARFPKVINIANYVGAFQDAVRGEYPLLDQQVHQGMTASIENNGAKFEVVSEQLWQFSDTKHSHALILSADFLVLHAGVGYESSEDFIGRFVAALKFLKGVPGLNIQHVQGLGYRYINLVAPRVDQGEVLSRYLAAWALPTETPSFAQEGLQFTEGAHVSAFRTEFGVLRLQALRVPAVTMPLDLDGPFVRQNGWVPARPEGEFAVLDIDHSGSFTPHPLEPDLVREKFFALRASARLIFDRATTKYAMDVWKGQR